jgi:glyoxylase-like metal-dependent hydrolase (beta-lactamase superfamily II)
VASSVLPIFETFSFRGYDHYMIHEILSVGPLQCNCSILGDEVSHEAMVIDPGADVSEILAIVARHGLHVKQIVVTHAHLDHIGGAMALKTATGAPILLNENDAELVAMLPMQAQWLGMKNPGRVDIDGNPKGGDKVSAGSLSGEVMLTPGHTEGSICLYFEPEKKLIAGDTLFAGSIGRTDLPGGSFEKILRSLHTKVLELPDDVIVIPGHGPLTTIGEEREGNPFLQK